MQGFLAALSASFVMAVVSTLGDFVWATWIPQHRPVFGMTHGIVLFLVAGLVLGVRAGRPTAGAAAGAAIGGAAAASFYLLAPLVGYAAMFVCWIGLWVALAVANAWLDAHASPASHVLARGGIAALASGAAFYAISGIWRPFDPAGWDYAVHFGAWTVAYLPGFAALFVGRRLDAAADAVQVRVAADEDGAARNRH
jgi:hypothetical protein